MGKIYFTGFYYCIIILILFSCRDKASVAPPPAMEYNTSEQIQISNLPLVKENIDSLVTKTRIWLQNDQADSAKLAWLRTARNTRFHKDEKISIYTSLGELYYREHNYDSALYWFTHSMPQLETDIKQEELKACIYAFIGSIYQHKNQLDSATFYLYKGLDIINKTPKVTEYTYAYNVYCSIGAFLFSVKQTEIAQYYLTKAGEIALQHNDTRRMAEALSSKAALYADKQQLDSAILTYKTILKEKDAKESTKLEAYLNLGLIYSSQDFKSQPEKGIPYIEKGLSMANNSNTEKYMRTKFLFTLGIAYMNMAMQKNQPSYYRKAEEIYSNLAETNNFGKLTLQDLKYFYSNYGIISYKLGEYKKSAELYHQSLAIRDSQYKQNTLSSINQSELQTRTAAKDKLIAQNKLQLAQQQNKIQRQYMWIGGITSIALIATLVFIVILRRRQHRTELARLKDIMTGEEKERTRIAQDLHDGIVSQLSAIKINFSNLPVLHPDMNEASDDFQSALQQLEQSIAELRTTSHNLLPEILQRTGLAEAVDTYCHEISRMTPCAVEFILVGALPKLKQDFQLTIYRIVQELLQNVIKHSGATDALVQFNADAATLRITVDDNGSGLTPEQQFKLNGIGLSNLQQRMATLGGKMDIETESGKGTSVYLSFDLKNKTEKV